MGKLQVGVNDLLTWCKNNGEQGERLIQEWTGITEQAEKEYLEQLKEYEGLEELEVSNHEFDDFMGNNEPEIKKISMEEITKASARKVKWACSKCNHKWFSTIANRINGHNCPKCKAKRTGERNRTPTKGINDLYSWYLQNCDQGQRLIEEWQGLDENNNTISIDSLTKGSGKKVKWRCQDCSYEWVATIHSRTNGRNCPACANRVVISGNNDLHTWCLQAGEQGHRLLQEWTGLDENNNSVNMNYVTKSYYKKFKWKCRDCDHLWVATIGDRTRGSNCPACANRVVIPGFNDLHSWCLQNGERGQRLIQEWIGLDENNNSISIDSVIKSCYKKFKWRCNKCNQEWFATVESRTHGINCPYCNTRSTSYPEQLIYHSLKRIFPKTISRGKFNNYEYDIAIPELKVCIEYSGYYYHQDKLARDTEKSCLCKKHGVHFIQIYCHKGELINSENLMNILHTFNYTEDDLDESGDLFTPNLIIYQQSIDHDTQLKNILSFLLNQFNHSIDEIDFDKAIEDTNKFIHKDN